MGPGERDDAGSRRWRRPAKKCRLGGSPTMAEKKGPLFSKGATHAPTDSLLSLSDENSRVFDPSSNGAGGAGSATGGDAAVGTRTLSRAQRREILAFCSGSAAGAGRATAPRSVVGTRGQPRARFERSRRTNPSPVRHPGESSPTRQRPRPLTDGPWALLSVAALGGRSPVLRRESSRPRGVLSEHLTDCWDIS